MLCDLASRCQMSAMTASRMSMALSTKESLRSVFTLMLGVSGVR